MTSGRWKRMEDLFHAAEALPPGERESFLAHECSDDESLRRDVVSLLEQSTRDGILSEPAVKAPAPVPDLMLDRHLGQLFLGYRLQSLLGAGGMGEVYLAHDTKLGRDVAVKVLPQEFTKDPDRLARFEREARMLATLNHPNICGIYGLEEADGIRFLVLELVEGQTLAVRLGEAGGPLPVPEALNIGRQIAHALEVAHDRGVIHRDLKPSNVKITPAQVVKVLDFGLAKSVALTGAADDLTHVPGRPDDASGSPLVMGTTAYMSPEQVQGYSRRQAYRRLGFRCRALRDGYREAAIQGTDRDRDAGLDPQNGARLGRPAARCPSRRATAAPPLPSEGSSAPAAVDRRRARSDRDPDPRWRR